MIVLNADIIEDIGLEQTRRQAKIINAAFIMRHDLLPRFGRPFLRAAWRVIEPRNFNGTVDFGLDRNHDLILPFLKDRQFTDRRERIVGIFEALIKPGQRGPL